MSEQPRSLTIANLQAAKSAIALQKNWATAKLKNSKGQMCALGAVAHVLSINLYSAPYNKLEKTPEVAALAAAVKGDKQVRWPEDNTDVVWLHNDTEGFEAVHRMFDDAIKALQNQT